MTKMFEPLIIGKTVSEATEIMKEKGLLLRVVNRNNVNLIVTQEFNIDRCNVSVVDNIVIGFIGMY